MKLALLWYCLRITRDYRKRRAIAEATADLNLDALKAGYHDAMQIVAGYVQERPRPSMRRAEQALILATVLREQIIVKEGLWPPPTYLRSRRALLSHARKWRQDQPHKNVR